MPSRLPALILLVAASAFAQSPPPAAVLGPPSSTRQAPIIQGLEPILDPFIRPLGPPDQPFRPFAPLGPPPAPAEEGIGTRFGLGVLAGRYGIPGYGVAWVPSQPVSAQPTTLSVVRQDLSIFAPIYREGSDTAAVGFGVRNSLFSTDAILPSSGQPFPGALWDIEAGMSYSHQWDAGWTSGVVVSFGSASDKPFVQSNVLIASLALYGVLPMNGNDAWIVGATYSPTSDTPYPLPILAYYWKPNADLEMTIGLPFLVHWQFAPSLAFDGLYIPVRTISARVTWVPEGVPDLRFYAGYNWANESWFLADRTENNQRFYSYEQRIGGGMQIDLPWRLRLDLGAGYAFDRYYFQGKQYSDKNNDRVNVGSGVYMSFQFRLRF